MPSPSRSPDGLCGPGRTVPKRTRSPETHHRGVPPPSRGGGWCSHRIVFSLSPGRYPLVPQKPVDPPRRPPNVTARTHRTTCNPDNSREFRPKRQLHYFHNLLFSRCGYAEEPENTRRQLWMNLSGVVVGVLSSARRCDGRAWAADRSGIPPTSIQGKGKSGGDGCGERCSHFDFCGAGVRARLAILPCEAGPRIVEQRKNVGAIDATLSLKL